MHRHRWRHWHRRGCKHEQRAPRGLGARRRAGTPRRLKHVLNDDPDLDTAPPSAGPDRHPVGDAAACAAWESKTVLRWLARTAPAFQAPGWLAVFRMCGAKRAARVFGVSCISQPKARGSQARLAPKPGCLHRRTSAGGSVADAKSPHQASALAPVRGLHNHLLHLGS